MSTVQKVFAIAEGPLKNNGEIQSVYDQTLEGMRKGERPDELVAHVKLPQHLAGSPYLQEYYGTVEWSVRAIYSDHLGWFDGNATHLFPMPETERAQGIVALAGGVPQTLSRGREAQIGRASCRERV